MTSDEWIAYLSGDKDAVLDPAEQAQADELAGILADESLWVEPDPALEGRIHAAITGGVIPITRRRSRRLPYTLLGLAAAALLAVGIAVPLINKDSSKAGTMVFAAKLTGTALAPTANGQATLTQTASGWRINLIATGLPRRAGTGYYEAWLKNSDGVLVPIGTFNQPDNVILWAGVPPSGFPTLTVTRQRANGNPASSGQVVLVGVSSRSR